MSYTSGQTQIYYPRTPINIIMSAYHPHVLLGCRGVAEAEVGSLGSFPAVYSRCHPSSILPVESIDQQFSVTNLREAPLFTKSIALFNIISVQHDITYPGTFLKIYCDMQLNSFPEKARPNIRWELYKI